jgi:hypothetical protein
MTVWPFSVNLQSQIFVEAWELWSVGRAQRDALDACCTNDLGWQWHHIFCIKVEAKLSGKKGAVEQKKRAIVPYLFSF